MLTHTQASHTDALKTHGTQGFSPKLRKLEKKLPRLPQRTGTPGKDMLYYTIKMKTPIYIM